MKTEQKRLPVKEEAILMKAIEIRALIAELKRKNPDKDPFYLNECDDLANELSSNIICWRFPDIDDYNCIARLYELPG